MMLTYNQFKEDLLDMIQTMLSEEKVRVVISIGYPIESGDEVDEILILETDGIINADYSITQLYRSLTEGGREMEWICFNIVREYMKYHDHAIEMKNTLDQVKKDYQLVKKYLRPVLINRERNADVLLECPHLEWGDMALLSYIALEIEGDYLTLPVNYDLLKDLQISEQTLLADTLEVHQAGLQLYALSNLNYKYENDIEPENLLYLEKDKVKAITEKEEVYILSNETFFMAAGVLADSEIMHQISDILDDDYYILPVCQHELLIAPKSRCRKTIQELQAELKDINEHEWEPEDVLSECVMVYERSRRRIGTIHPDQSMSYNLMPDFIRATRRNGVVWNRMAQG